MMNALGAAAASAAAYALIGTGLILAGCFSDTPCHLRTTVAVWGATVATTGSECAPCAPVDPPPAAASGAGEAGAAGSAAIAATLHSSAAPAAADIRQERKSSKKRIMIP